MALRFPLPRLRVVLAGTVPAGTVLAGTVLAGTVLAVAALAITPACTSPASTPPPSTAAAEAPVTAFPPGRLVDLSHTYDATTIFWPTAETFRLDKVADGETPAGFYYAANNFAGSEHGGTHLDAPVHFSRGGQTVDQIPLDRLVGAAYVVDVTAQAAANSDHQVTVEDLTRTEAAQGPIPRDAILLLRTGFSTRWPDAQRYLGTAERGEAAAARLHFPGLHPDAARWLVANRPVKAVGIDTASIDYGPSTTFETHQVLYGQGIPGFENLTRLDELPPTGAWLVALPMKIGGGSGAPLRAVAIVPAR